MIHEWRFIAFSFYVVLFISFPSALTHYGLEEVSWFIAVIKPWIHHLGQKEINLLIIGNSLNNSNNNNNNSTVITVITFKSHIFYHVNHVVLYFILRACHFYISLHTPLTPHIEIQLLDSCNNTDWSHMDIMWFVWSIIITKLASFYKKVSKCKLKLMLLKNVIVRNYHFIEGEFDKTCITCSSPFVKSEKRKQAQTNKEWKEEKTIYYITIIPVLLLKPTNTSLRAYLPSIMFL